MSTLTYFLSYVGLIHSTPRLGKYHVEYDRLGKTGFSTYIRHVRMYLKTYQLTLELQCPILLNNTNVPTSLFFFGKSFDIIDKRLLL